MNTELQEPLYKRIRIIKPIIFSVLFSVLFSVAIFVVSEILREFSAFVINNYIGYISFGFTITFFTYFNRHLYVAYEKIEDTPKRFAMRNIIIIALAFFLYSFFLIQFVPNLEEVLYKHKVIYNDTVLAVVNLLIVISFSLYLTFYAIQLRKKQLNHYALSYLFLNTIILLFGSFNSSQIEAGYSAEIYPVLGILVVGVEIVLYRFLGKYHT